MSYPKLKSENYQNLQGMNTKSSKYTTAESEFLNLQNVDFQTFGSLSTTPGYTQYMLSGITGPITGISEYSQSAVNPFLNQVATTNYAAFNITGHTFQKTYDSLFVGNTIFPIAFGTFSMFDFVRGSSVLYGANGLDFFSAFSIGPSYLQYSLPYPWQGSTTTGTMGSTGGISGSLELDFAFIRSDGLIGPFIGNTYPNLSGYTGFRVDVPVMPPNLGITYSNFGISGVVAWYSLNGSSPKRLSPSLLLVPGSMLIINDQFSSFIINEPPEDIFGSYYMGMTYLDAGTAFFPFPPLGPVNPSTLEAYNSQLFMSGFVNNPSTVWYSNIGEFEKRDPENFFLVGDDDGDIVSNLISYFTQLIIFKVNSTWMLSGQDLANFSLVQATDQYGCLSNNSACVFEQKLWFLDRKGICEFNGANTRIVSNKIEPIFRRINISAARITAAMSHVKSRNQVWCDFPIDGSNYNNMRAVYDYLADAWTTVPIDQTTCLTKESKSYTLSLPFFGNYSGMIYQYGQSLTLNNGVGPTHVIQTRFIHDMGHSVEKQFRRLYVDALIPSGSTQTWVANFYTNQGSTAAMSMTLVLSDFQRRFDFGLPAADMSIEFIYSGGQFLQLNGYTIEYRFQRDTTYSS